MEIVQPPYLDDGCTTLNLASTNCTLANTIVHTKKGTSPFWVPGYLNSVVASTVGSELFLAASAVKAYTMSLTGTFTFGSPPSWTTLRRLQKKGITAHPGLAIVDELFGPSSRPLTQVVAVCGVHGQYLSLY